MKNSLSFIVRLVLVVSAETKTKQFFQVMSVTLTSERKRIVLNTRRFRTVSLLNNFFANPLGVDLNLPKPGNEVKATFANVKAF